MARKKRKMDDFKQSELDKTSQKKVKGGYKYGPSGASFVGSFIWESIDIRGNQEGGNTISELTYRRG